MQDCGGLLSEQITDHQEMNMSDDLKTQYDTLFAACVPNTKNAGEIKEFINQLFKGIAKYEQVESIVKVPWYVIGLIHGLEADFSFKAHLHNGDPLTHRTVNEPKGRPPTGDPPFEWTFSALDALQYDHFIGWTDWSIGGICYKLEGYNGFGYRRHGINTPYLWSMSNNYVRGKFVSDGSYDSDAVSSQVGAMTALKQMISDDLIALPAQTAA